MQEQRRYSWSVFYPIARVLTEAGFGRVAHVPAILDSTLNYDTLAARYLIDRALGIWPEQRGLPISAATLRTIAHSICNFSDWCDCRNIDRLEADYQSVLISRYQQEMLKGIWSASGEGLSPATINLRIDYAIELLNWAADHGLRDALVVPTKISRIPGPRKATSSVGHHVETIETRRGKLRQPKRHLGMPTEEAVGAWLRRIYDKPIVGATEGLFCELVLETALRRAEVAGFRVDTLPRDPEDWSVVDRGVPLEHQQVLIDIRYGTKGPEYGRDHGDKVGPVGTIRIPMSLALRLHRYRNVERAKALNVAMKRGKRASEQRRIRDETVHMFLHPLTGERYSASQIYHAWRSVELPQPGWTVHRGRDFWACMTLWRAMLEHKSLLSDALERHLDERTLGLIRSNALSIIELQIQPQLRHANRETSMIYLQWLGDRLGLGLGLHENYVEALSTEGEDET